MTKFAELYACLCAREFPAQALLRLRPELRDQPCVVMEGAPPLEQVCSLNTKARLLGMTRGMTRVEIDTFPASVVLPRSLKTEARTRTILLECAGAFSPRVEDRSEDAAFLCGIDIAGTGSLFGPPEKLARSLLERVRAAGVAATVSVSTNFHAAVCTARDSSLRIAVRVIPSGEEATALANLPVAVLDLTEMQAETFASWGIRTLGMLAALPERDLIARLGQDGKRLRQLARGELPHLFQPIEPGFTLSERMELDSPVELLDSLLFVAGVMLDQLILRAKARIVALASVTIVLALDGGGIHARTVRPALPSSDKQLWIKLLHLDLEANPPQAAILSVSLDAEPGSTSKVQLGLLSPQLPEASRLDVTLARIRAIVGEENVGSAALVDTHAPEGFRMEPFTLLSSDPSAIAPVQLRASTRQIRPPEAAPVTFENGRLAMFVFRGRRFAIERAYGPWLVGGEWWNQTLWGQEQWDLVAQAQDGSTLHCCLVRDLIQGSWQVAALYD
ncbi:MAG: DNA polymerase Y family protein [Terracidiphilus sp.]